MRRLKSGPKKALKFCGWTSLIGFALLTFSPWEYSKDWRDGVASFDIKDIWKTETNVFSVREALNTDSTVIALSYGQIRMIRREANSQRQHSIEKALWKIEKSLKGTDNVFAISKTDYDNILNTLGIDYITWQNVQMGYGTKSTLNKPVTVQQDSVPKLPGQ